MFTPTAYDIIVPGKAGPGNAWRLAPAPFYYKGERMMENELSAEERVEIVRELLGVFTPEDRDTILEILRHIMAAAHSPLSI